jgi:hypothetical protein
MSHCAGVCGAGLAQEVDRRRHHEEAEEEETL